MVSSAALSLSPWNVSSRSSMTRSTIGGSVRLALSFWTLSEQLIHRLSVAQEPNGELSP